VEIENSIESSIGVALPPASLMRARTIGQIAALIAEHMGDTAGKTATPPAVSTGQAAPVEVDLEALSDEEIHQLLGEDAATAPATAPLKTEA
jgi:hypothetical protein